MREALIVFVFVVLALVASLALSLSLSGEGDGWKTYRNFEYGYEVRYPADWQIVVTPKQIDPISKLPDGRPFQVQGVRLTNGAEVPSYKSRVLVYVNFQGGWCESGDRYERRSIDVSGVRGVEDKCWWPPNMPCQPEPVCRETPVEQVRLFEGARGWLNYAVLASNVDPAQVGNTRKVVESFRFLH